MTDVIYKVELYASNEGNYYDSCILEKELTFADKELAIKSFDSMLLECNSIIRGSDEYFDTNVYDANILPNIDFLKERKTSRDKIVKWYSYSYEEFYFFDVKLTTHTVEELLKIQNTEYQPVIVKLNYYQDIATDFLNY